MAEPPNLDQPTPYGEKAKQEAQGWFDVGVFDALEGVVNNGLTKAANGVAQLFFGSIDAILVLIAKAIFAVLGELDPAFGTIASLIVGNLFDVRVDTSAFTNLYDTSSRKAIATAVGENLLKAFKGDQANVGAGELQPSTLAAEQYLGVMANLAIEGWTFDTLGGLLPFVHLEHLGALNEEMARVLGLGRMSRAVLRPFVNTLIQTPALWAVNKQYRPKMLTVAEAIRANFRGDIPDDVVREIAARDGYGDDALAALINAERKHLSPADLDLRVRSELMERDDAIAALRAQSYEDTTARELFDLEELKARRAHIFRLANVAIAAYAERRIDDVALGLAIDRLGFDQTTLSWLHDEATARRNANVLHLTRGEIEAAIEAEVLSIADYAPWLESRGYGHDDAITLELTLMAKMKKLDDAKHARELAAATRAANKAAQLQAQQAKRDAVAREHADWTGTIGEAERLVVRDVMPPSQYQQILVDHGLSAGDAAALVTVAIADRDARDAAAAKRAALASKVKTPATPIAALEHAVILGARSIGDLRAELEARHYAPDDVQLLVDLVTRELADRTALQAKRDALAAAPKGKQLSIGTLEAAVVDGALTLDQYRARLVAAKYSATDVAVLVALLEQKLKDHAFALERHARAAQKLEASHVSLANEEKAVVDKILTVADYQAWLVAHDFDASDVAIMTALLETKLNK
jgi:hypothetical protein